MVLGLQNALWRSKLVLEQLYHFGRQKVSAWQVLYKGFCGSTKFCELLAPKCSFGALGALWVLLGPRAGWLAAEGSEPRAEGSWVRAQSSGLRAHG